jgi:hypothetical protein
MKNIPSRAALLEIPIAWINTRLFETVKDSELAASAVN